MPFEETCPVEERIALLRDYETGVFTVSELCRRFGDQPGDVLRLEAAPRERGGALVRGTQPRGGGLSACDGWPRRRSHHRDTATVSAFRSEEDQGVAGARGAGGGLAGGLDDRRHPQARGAGGAEASPSPRDRAGRDGDAGDALPTRNGRSTSRAGSAPATAARCDPLTITDAASRYLIELRIVEPNVCRRQERSGAGFRRGRPAGGDPIRQRCSVRLDRGRRPLGAVGVVAQARHRAALHPSVRARKTMAGTSACIAR